jgi:hypothetical protein
MTKFLAIIYFFLILSFRGLERLLIYFRKVLKLSQYQYIISGLATGASGLEEPARGPVYQGPGSDVSKAPLLSLQDLGIPEGTVFGNIK